MIPFNRPTQTGSEQAFVTEALNQNLLSGNGTFTQRCEQWFEASFAHTQSRALLTSSCTHALEMAAILLDIKEGDESSCRRSPFQVRRMLLYCAEHVSCLWILSQAP